MTRSKGIAPAPPVRPKPTVKFNSNINERSDANTKVTQSPSTKINLQPFQSTAGSSLVLLFDELTRNSKVLREGGSEEQFLQFAVSETVVNDHADNEMIAIVPNPFSYTYIGDVPAFWLLWILLRFTFVFAG